MKIQDSTKKHSIFSPSSSDRWLKCVGSVLFPDEKENSHTILGNQAHLLASESLKNDDYLALFRQNQGSSFQIPEELYQAVESYRDFVKELGGFEPGTKLIVEEKVEFYDLANGGFGTLDCAVVSEDSQSVQVIDFKYGTFMVKAFENPQLLLYLYGVLRKLGLVDYPKKMILHIFQPRAKKIRSRWVVEKEYLKRFSGKVKKVFATYQENPKTFSPGESQCRWCPGRGICPETQGKFFFLKTKNLESGKNLGAKE